MTMDVMRDGLPVKAAVPLRVVEPPSVTGTPWAVAAPGSRTREALLGPLSMRERALVCAVAEALQAMRERAEYVPGSVLADPHATDAYGLDFVEKQGLLGLLVAFKDATGCAFSEAEW